MSFLYPDTISIRRPNVQAGAGALAYSGETEANETVVVTGLRASIQNRGGRGRAPGNLPADAESRADWYIYIPRADLAQGATTERDIIVDGFSKRYLVNAAYWNSMGYRLSATLLEM